MLVLRSVGYPAFYTFRDRLEWNEDLIYRNLNPPRAFMIEIGRLSQFYDIQPVADGPILNRHFRTFIAKQKGVDKKARGGDRTRFFVRALVLGRVMADREESKCAPPSVAHAPLVLCSRAPGVLVLIKSGRCRWEMVRRAGRGLGLRC